MCYVDCGMNIQKFEQVPAWQKAQALAMDVYEAMLDVKDYGFKDQIRNAVVSISNNIAEGYEHDSKTEFSRFLYYALGYATEIKSMLDMAVRLGYLTQQAADQLQVKTKEVSDIITALIQSLKNPDN